jgi:ParB family transcriptional regulator, chromosome partitioning protein
VPAKRSGLGRGLDALLPKSEGAVQQVPLARLQPSPFQPRRQFDPAALAELAASIRDKGVLQPLLVRPVAQGFEIVAGERRFRAAGEAGLESVPVIVRTLSDRETLEIAIVENLQREDLSPLEEAQAFKQLLGLGLSQEQVAQAVGKSRSAIANTLRLLQLPEAALAALALGEISAGHARAILAQPEEDRAWALEQIRTQELTVRQAEALKRPQTVGSRTRRRIRELQPLEEELARTVGTRVAIKGQGKGKIELYYFSEEELGRLLELLGYRG